ncbi:LysR family transcriptional regulator [Gymnodinialimonas ceratoperidinii]|uniref:LysR family transcriptional regulator n=1 Tax=Gymnodinialimonas ceratoperidinii TaxID=2856823 RepID=A0A8F6YBU6_9RHOB|nr:LysR family transcriptional regulator [Gymnodinialimonas ceratoperidinii]QXT38575.1 LysR family transcriptional regulator [Gymnodinialimonas ceratoperidinii]
MIHKLEMFIAVAREGHFGRAAESLGLTQPTLSTGIKQLEEMLGVQLIFRGSRYGGLTPEGQRALVWARQLVSDARAFRQEMRTARHGLSGIVRLAVIPTALTWAAQLSARFTAAHPNVRFTILSRTSVEILSMLENLEVDAGLSYLDNEPLGRVTMETLYQEKYTVVCHRESDIALQERVEWADLAGERLCLLTPNMQNRRIINENFMAAGISPEAQVESNSTVVLAAHVQAGGWITVLPIDMARFLCAGKPELVIRELEGQGMDHAVGLVAPYREPHTPVLTALIAETRALSKKGVSSA